MRLIKMRTFLAAVLLVSAVNIPTNACDISTPPCFGCKVEANSGTVTCSDLMGNRCIYSPMGFDPECTFVTATAISCRNLWCCNSGGPCEKTPATSCSGGQELMCCDSQSSSGYSCLSTRGLTTSWNPCPPTQRMDANGDCECPFSNQVLINGNCVDLCEVNPCEQGCQCSSSGGSRSCTCPEAPAPTPNAGYCPAVPAQ